MVQSINNPLNNNRLLKVYSPRAMHAGAIQNFWHWVYWMVPVMRLFIGSNSVWAGGIWKSIGVDGENRRCLIAFKRGRVGAGVAIRQDP